MMPAHPADLTPEAAAAQRLDALAKPPGSLGGLEGLAVRLAGAQRRYPPSAERARVIVFAADHGVARAEAVTPYPPEVTVAMVHTFAAGQAAVAVLARSAGAELEVVDVGVVGLGPVEGRGGVRVVRAAVAAGTANLAVGPAMSPERCAQAMAVGAAAAQRAHADGVELLALGEMGIGNTTAAAALTARLLGRSAAEVVGPGTGLDPAGVERKRQVVERALARGGAADGAGALADLGGLELAALAGCMIEAARLDLPVLLDGFIVGASALAAVRLHPDVRRVLIPATRSPEPGHRLVLEALDLGPPLLDLGLRLGEASAATLALPMARSACRLLTEMATLEAVLSGALA